MTIDASPEAVWPWLVQAGFGRAGWYSDDLLDNLARPSLREVRPELQTLEVGQWVPMSPTPTDASAFKVAGFVEKEWLLLAKSDSTWSWVLTDLGDGRTRLVTRVHALYDWTKPVSALAGVVLLELGDFPMMRRMLLGIKQRAEATAAEPLVPHPKAEGVARGVEVDPHVALRLVVREMCAVRQRP